MDVYRSLVQELRSRSEVRDVVVSTVKEGSATLGQFSSCTASESKDIEKTVRRMFAASSTIGSSLRRVTMYLGASALVAASAAGDAVNSAGGDEGGEARGKG